MHVHAYDEKTGRQNTMRICMRRSPRYPGEEDASCTTLPFAGSVDAPQMMMGFAHTETPVKRGRGGRGSGLTNITWRDPGAQGFVAVNPESHHPPWPESPPYGFHPGTHVRTRLRAPAALERAYPGVPQCIYRFMFSDGLSSLPPALRARRILRLLADEAPYAPWMVAGLTWITLITYAPSAAAMFVGLRMRRSAHARPTQLVEQAVGLIRWWASKADRPARATT